MLHYDSQYQCPERIFTIPYYAPYTLKTEAKFCSNSIYKFAGNTTAVDSILNKDHADYNKQIQNIVI